MGTLKNLKLKSNTIIETIVALTIMMIVFGVATTLFVETFKEQESLKTLKAKGILQEYTDRTISKKDFFNSSEQFGEFILKRKIIDSHKLNNILRINFSILDANQTIISKWDQIVIDEH